MVRQLIKLFAILVFVLYITGCGSKTEYTSEQQTGGEKESAAWETVSDLPEEDITEIDTIDNELDDSEVDDITGELADLDW
ncbi:hypothetical protein CMO89_01155 [Candidatus Woesearchaeota archaeon]|nr:hypothetical protein [Candidatus Woesearchaeota archaeon]|tara:strand:- start:15640 stop:15882 length:243 start_codon:yes stop_codon:yes gene_type:complete